MFLYTVIALACQPSPSSGSDGTDEPVVTSGPAAIPATFVDLDQSGFPLPFDEACGGRRVSQVVEAGQSIARALSEATAGSLIEVADGTYTENPAEWFALEWATDDVCLIARGEAVIEAAPGQGYGLLLSGDHSAISGLTFRGFETGIALEPQSGTLESVTLERITVDEMTGDFRDGIGIFGSGTTALPVIDGLLLSQVTIHDADLSLSCGEGPCDHLWFDRVTIHGRSTVDGSGSDALAVESGRQIVITNSLIDGAAADGIDIKGSDVVIVNTVVRDVDRNGLKLWRGGDVLNVVVDGSGADASLIGDGPGRYRYAHVLVTNHDPKGTGYVGTWGYDAGPQDISVEFINSAFTNNAAGGLFVAGDLTVQNTWFDQEKLFEVDGSTLEDISALEASGYGAGNHSGPVTLGAGYAPPTEFVDAGTPIPDLNTDVNGDPRPVGAAPDIGPVERQ